MTLRNLQPVGLLVFFSWWTRVNSRLCALSTRVQWSLLLLTSVIAVSARLLAQTFPYNYDFTAYVAVSDQVLAGGNPYETGKHNYGPIWFLLHSSLRLVAEEPEAFRVALALLFSMVDIGIGILLMKRGYLAAAILFLLAPVGIAISGQHGQFDNVSIVMALGSALLLTRGAGPIAMRDVWSVALMGLSLSTKHGFLLLPIWFALMQGTWIRRFFYGIVPYILFGLTLVPFWLINSTPIRDYVLNYRSNTNAPAYYSLLPDELVWGWVNRGYIVFLFLGILAILGWWYRKIPAFEATLIYGICLVVFSTAIVDQYFAIPMAGISVFLNIGFLAWLVYVSIYLLGEPEDFNLPIFDTLKLHLAPYQEGTYRDQFVFIFIGWIIMNVWLWRQGWIAGRSSRGEPATETEQQTGGKLLDAASDSGSATTR